MGILNATPDSFSDGGMHSDLERRGHELIAQGADLLDVGGESGVTNRPSVAPEVEIERVVPLIERLAGHRVISIDTYKAAVARAAIEAGASIVNDPSGFFDPDMPAVCAETGAALVITHTIAEPKQKLHDPRYADIVEDVRRFLGERIQIARAAGVADEQILLCPGPDMGKTPPQTVELLRGLDRLAAFERPLLLALSRKDFIGALTRRRPRARLAGTLAAIAHGVAHGGRVLRVHDVADVCDFLKVRAALEGALDVADDLRLADELRWEEVPPAAAKQGTG